MFICQMDGKQKTMFFLAIFLSFTVLKTWANQSDIAKDTFHEELLIKPLPSGHVYAYFQFTTLWENDFLDNPYQHSHLFPHSLGEVVGRHNVQELHISLTSGLWRHEVWGYPAVDAPPGAEVWAWFKEDTKDVDRSWRELAGALAGLLCASFNFIDPSKSLSPVLSFRPEGIVLNGTYNSSFIRYATLPREIVCTENLTPWKKLLPCDSTRGLATLLYAAHVYNTNYHSLGIHLRPVCKDSTCSSTKLELKQTVSLVHDLLILGSDSMDWSLRKLFGLGLAGSCPLATTSHIYIDITANMSWSKFVLQPPPQKIINSEKGGYRTVLGFYDVNKINMGGMFSIAAIHSGPRVYSINLPPILHASRYIIGYGQERGGITTKLYNNHWKAIDVVYLENIPWYVPLYYHTLRVTSNGRKIQPLLKHYVPGRERSRPYHLELVIQLPPRSVTEIYLEFDYMFLKWQEYPPDANHGFYVGAAVITSSLPHARNYTALPQHGSTILSSVNASQSGYIVRLRTEVLIITLPTPDFSMPYNVICLACTVVALAFGPLHNITTKRLKLKDNQEQKGMLTCLKNTANLIKLRVKSKISPPSGEKVEVDKSNETKEESK